MSTKQKVMAHLAKLGATVDGPHRYEKGGEVTGNFDAPAGKRWSHTDTHAVACCGDSVAQFWSNGWSDIGGEGLVDCSAGKDCDVCGEEQETEASANE